MIEFDSTSDYIIENNHQFLIANKPAGLPIHDDLTKDKSFLHILRNYTKSNLQLINRLDRPVSGAVLLSKKDSSQKYFRKLQDDSKIIKEYWAIVEGSVEGDAVLNNHLLHNRNARKAIIISSEKPNSNLVQLKYESQKVLDNYSILKIRLERGKFHQIRSQLGFIGHPIKGDVKYGARRSNKDRSILLHLNKMIFNHPVSKKEIEFSVPFPAGNSLWELVEAS